VARGDETTVRRDKLTADRPSPYQPDLLPVLLRRRRTRRLPALATSRSPHIALVGRGARNPL